MVAGSFIRISRSYVSSAPRVSMCFPNGCMFPSAHRMSVSGRAVPVTKKTTSDIDFAATAPYTNRCLEEINEENACTTTSPSATDMRDGGIQKKHSNRLAGNFE